MANTQGLKRRIRSVGNTRQITKAMEMVSAAKMRRVQASAASAHIYSDAAIAILQRAAGSPEANRHPFFKPAGSGAKLYIIISSDSGLAGAYNSNIFNLAIQAFREDRGSHPKVIALGRKGAHHFSRAADVDLIGDYENIPDDPDTNVFASIIETVHQGVTNGDFSSVELIYNEFRSSLNQKAVRLPLIPVTASQNEAENADHVVYELEPDAEAVLDSALKLYLESALRRARVEAAASEHAMRMMTMNNANRNAGDLIDNLRLELNATRQAAITQEMAEIIGGADAIA